MPYGLPWSEQFVQQLEDKELRDEFVADQVRTHIALAIRTLREQDGRDWSQADLGRAAGKPQSVISRLEDPDYGKLSLQTLLEIAAAFDLPLRVDLPEWSDWLAWVSRNTKNDLARVSFENADLSGTARDARDGQVRSTIAHIHWDCSTPATTTRDGTFESRKLATA